MITEDMVDVAAKYMWGAPTNQQRMLTKQVLVTAFAKAPRTEQFKDAIPVLKEQWKHAFPGSSGHTALLIIDMLSILEAQQTALIKHREAKIDKMDSVIKNFRATLLAITEKGSQVLSRRDVNALAKSALEAEEKIMHGEPT